MRGGSEISISPLFLKDTELVRRGDGFFFLDFQKVKFLMMVSRRFLF
jgi:hypothetical protein